MNFRKVDYCPLDIIKPYQRQKLSRAAKSVNRECGLTASIGVGSGERLCEKWLTDETSTPDVRL